MDIFEAKIDEIIQKMRFRINEEGVQTKKLAEIIEISLSMAGGIYKSLIGNIVADRIEPSIRQYLDFTKVIVEANWKANSILNPNLKIPSIEEQYQEELEKESVKKLKSLYPQYF